MLNSFLFYRPINQTMILTYLTGLLLWFEVLNLTTTAGIAYLLKFTKHCTENTTFSSKLKYSPHYIVNFMTRTYSWFNTKKSYKCKFNQIQNIKKSRSLF